MSNLIGKSTAESGFKIGLSADEPSREFLAVTGHWSTETTRVALQREIREVHLNAYSGWTDGDVEFLKELPQLESLHVAAGKGIDLSPIYQLPKLNLLSLAGEIKIGVDFPRISSLRELRLENWSSKKYTSALSCASLRVLALSNYPNPDLSSFSGLVSLQELRLSFGRVTSLHGVSSMTHLKRLTLQEFNHLDSLEGIEGLCELEDLWIYRAKKLRRLRGVEGLGQLRSITLTSLPLLESLRPLAKCAYLERVILLQNTNVLDGDLAVLKELPKLHQVRFNEREHYNLKAADF